MKALTLALWQTPYFPTVAEALQRLDEAAAQARAQGADLLVCPEMGLTGYAIGPERAATLAEPADGPMARAVARTARRHRIAIAYGYPEQHPDGGRPFNATQCIAANGRRIGHHRKTHLFGDMDRAQFSAGDQPSRPFAWRGWRLGLLICYDVEFPGTVRALAQQGLDALLVPTANMREYDEVPLQMVPARAADNRVFVAYANACGQEPGLHYGGLSTVAGPGGDCLGRSGRRADLLVTRLDRSTHREQDQK